jgi:serine/threonine protein kinase/tetratricopeptide (TPR) repeat protein
MIGKTVAQYRILRKLGEGGMGTVYLAHDTDLDRQVALKFLTKRVSPDDPAMTRFKREARAVAALNHPAIIDIYEIGDDEGVPYIAMPYIEGQILGELMANGPLPVEQAMEIVQQVCAGLERAHAAGIVHRDVKPGNILVDRNGRVKILDFGLAKVETEPQVTADHSLLGTVCYMSPEQARGEEVDGRSDIFSLGCVLYEMLAGQRAFKGDRAAGVLYAIEHAQPSKIRDTNPAVPAALERVVTKMLAKQLAQRYATIEEVAADLPLDSISGSTRSTIRRAAPQPKKTSKTIWIGDGAALLIVLIAATFWISTTIRQPTEQTAPPTPADRIMIAVLPFENLGAPGDEYFAEGITEEINSRLASVPQLGVISRTSTRQYKGSGKTVKVIAGELGVDYVLEGTVRWDRSSDTDRVLITPQLIRVSDDTYAWSEQYDRVIDDLFRTQSDIAGRVIDSLNVTLLASTREIIEAQPTDNFEAYQAYLRGLEAARAADYSAGLVELGQSMFERAVALDQNFAQAHAELSRLHSRSYHLGLDRTPERLALARSAADRAQALAPTLVQTRLALAFYYYWGLKDYPKALEQLDAASENTANDTQFLEARGYILRRQGDYALAADNLLHAFELNPRDPVLAVEVANTHLGLWRFEKAREFYDISISLAPDRVGPYTLKVRNQYLWDGDLAAARATLDEMPAGDAIRPAWFRAFHEFFERDYASVIEQLEPLRGETYQTHAQTIPISMVIAWAHEQRGDTASAQAAYEEALAVLDAARDERPDDFRTRMALGLVHAGLDHRDEAIRLGQEALAMYPMSKDAWAGPIVVRNMVLLLARAGAVDAALEQIDFLLSFPNPGASPALFRIEPRLDDLRDLPRFQAILAASPVEES